MNTSFVTNYRSLEEDIENPENVMIHVASEGSKSRWNHIDDLDTFFNKIYIFHQEKGFLCILSERLKNVLIAFLIACSIFTAFNCIRYDIKPIDIHLKELFTYPATCYSSAGFWSKFFFCIAMIAVAFQCIYYIRHNYSFKEIEQFYESELKISKNDINYVTWHEVQCRLREVQHEQQMCVHKSDLTELDIYHRILRNKNYMVALVNKNILPLTLNVPYFGEWLHYSQKLEFIYEILLFGSFSPFKCAGTRKDDYKKYSKRKEVAQQLEGNITKLAVICFISMPLLLAWGIAHFIYQYLGFIRFEPSVFGFRKWSPFARVYLRHFNELDHEENARLARAYKPGEEFMKCFSDPLIVIISKFLRSGFGLVAVSLIVWACVDELVLTLKPALVIVAFCSLAFYALGALQPDENAIYIPENSMQKIIANIHYAPDYFKTHAHTLKVRDEFSRLFPYHITCVLEELSSPLVIWYILYFKLRPRALEIVDFFRCFTVDVAGVGDVCSFALMDVSKHGHQHWAGPVFTKVDQMQQAEDGKTELSLIHFKMMNPQWVPPDPSIRFFDDFKEQVTTSRAAIPIPGQVNPYYSSLNYFSSMGSQYASLVNSIHHSQHFQEGSTCMYSLTSSGYRKRRSRIIGLNVTRAEGPLSYNQDDLPSLTANSIDAHSVPGLNPIELRGADMSLSALFLHEIHEIHVDEGQEGSQTYQPAMQESINGNEEAPLLEIRRIN